VSVYLDDKGLTAYRLTFCNFITINIFYFLFAVYIIFLQLIFFSNQVMSHPDDEIKETKSSSVRPLSLQSPQQEDIRSITKVQSILKYENYTDILRIGILKAAITLGIDLPLEGIQTRMQALSIKVKYTDVIKSVYTTQSIKGLYAGITPKLSSSIIRNSCRWYMIDTLPGIYQDRLSQQFEMNYPYIKLILTGASIATFDTLALTPFERWKVMLMTRESNKSLCFNFSDRSILKELFRGSTTVGVQSLYAWSTFLLADYQLQYYTKKHTVDEITSLYWMLGTSISMGFLNSCLLLPIQVVKTQFQKENPLENKGIIKTMKGIVKSQGYKGLYIGWRIDVVRSIIFSIFDFFFLKQLNSKKYDK